jgi:hypothetical protein
MSGLSLWSLTVPVMEAVVTCAVSEKPVRAKRAKSKRCFIARLRFDSPIY